MGEKKAVIKVSVPFVSADIAGSPGVRMRGDHAARMRYLEAIAVEAESVAGDFGGSVIEAIAIDGPMPSVMSPDGLGLFCAAWGVFSTFAPIARVPSLQPLIRSEPLHLRAGGWVRYGGWSCGLKVCRRRNCRR